MATQEPPLVTLATDFGEGSPYVAEIKGVLYTFLPHAQIVDLTHAIPPQDVAQAAWEIAQAVTAFPSRTIHIIVVDPDVGTERRILAGTVGGKQFIAPDNGVLSVCLGRAGRPLDLVALDQPAYWRAGVSPTFHGRDIMAPIAAHWLSGVPLELLGSRVTHPQLLADLWPRQEASRIVGRWVRADTFGNLITNIETNQLTAEQLRGAIVELWDGRQLSLSVTYGSVARGQLLALIGSSGYVEVAIHGGSALRTLAAQRNQSVVLEWVAAP